MRPFLTLHHPSTARAYYEGGFWTLDTFYTLMAKNATTQPNSIALRDGRRSLSWNELQRAVDGMAAHLRDLGLVRGDRVSLWISNRVEVLIAFLACSREGFACNPSLHRTYTSAEIAELLNRLTTRALITEPGWGADRATIDLSKALASVPSLKTILQPENFPSPSAPANPPVTDPDKVVYLAFTSGTTGPPKCVMHSDNSLLANARDMVRDWRIGSDTVLLCLAPFSHHIGWVATGEWLLSGCQLVMNSPPAGKTVLDWLLEVKATYVMGVPTHAMDLLAEHGKRGMKDLGAVKIFYMAGAAIPPTVAQAFFGMGIKVQNVYGMTENSSHQYTHPDDSQEIMATTCGRGGPAYEVRLFDPADEDKPVITGETGHLGGRGPALMLGYFANQAATEGSFNKEGWFLSGDLAIADAAGNMQIVGRLKDIIIRGGHNIHPAHIEALALRHDQVSRVACFPVPDERLGERVCIAVIGAAEPHALLNHLAAEGLSKYDMPEYFVRLEELPMTASGKILKRSLTEMVRQGALKPQFLRGQNAEAVS
jgi:acyl-CoA synthetase